MARILVLDDNEDLSLNMKRYLTARSHEVTTVDCVEDAHEKLIEADFDLLILDWELPDGSGPDVCKMYRDRGGLAGVMMLTGRSNPEDKVTGFNAGADDYLTKPFNIPEFGVRVEALLRRSAIQKKAPALAYDESLLGKTFADNYLIESVLGKGSMGFVYKASHKTIKRVAAIKVLSGKNVGPTARKRFEREARAMSLLDHPNLVKIYEFGFAEDIPYIVMEYVEGAPLNEVLKTNGALAIDEAMPLCLGICQGLEHAHAQSIIHRDLKPANIIICAGGAHAKVVDLGLAKYIDDNSDPGAEGNSELTFAGEIFGSPAYMSPEQGTNRVLDQRSDLYSMGCVMYEMFSGQRCFSGYSFVDVINAKLQSKPPSLCEKFPQAKFPLELDRCIRKSLDPDPGKRQANMTELIAELQRVPFNSVKEKKSSSELLNYVKKFLGKND